MKRRRLLCLLVLLALTFVLHSCGFLWDEFFTLDLATPTIDQLARELR